MLPANVVARHPVRPEAYDSSQAGFSPFARGKDLLAFDGEKAQFRRDAIFALFDILITERWDELKTIWTRIHAAEAPGAAAAQANAKAMADAWRRKVARARSEALDILAKATS